MVALRPADLRDGDRDQLQTMNETRPDCSAKRCGTIGKGDHETCGGQRERSPGGEATSQSTGAQQAEGESDLAGGGLRQKLAKRDKIGVGGLVEPFAFDHEFGAEISEMGYRAAEGGEP